MGVMPLGRQLAATISRRLGRRRRLVDSVYDLARLEEAGTLQVRPKRFAPASRATGVVSAVAPEVVPRFEIAIPPDLELMLDPDAFDRIAAHLVRNAVQYGSPPFRISAERGDDHLSIHFEDGGRGVSPQFEPRLFDHFARSEISRGESDGAGLGLALSRLYARASGGDLVYEAAPGGGARFSLVLPLSSVVPVPAQAERRRERTRPG